jgi:hypothetical protein
VAPRAAENGQLGSGRKTVWRGCSVAYERSPGLSGLTSAAIDKVTGRPALCAKWRASRIPREGGLSSNPAETRRG